LVLYIFWDDDRFEHTPEFGGGERRKASAVDILEDVISQN
jgi:hypothetical protein